MGISPGGPHPHAAPPAGYSVRCGRCGVLFHTRECRKLEHFSIYRVICPHCHWPGRYLASELHAAHADKALGGAKNAA